jgi:hypothetical protein
MGRENEVEEVLPEVELIEDEELRATVIRIWANALEESEFENFMDLPWSSTFIPVVGNDETQVGHIRETLACVLSYVDTIQETRPDLEINRDYLIAGTLLHDISKFLEISSDSVKEGANIKTELADNLSHPHYGLHLLAEEDLPIEILNIVLAHTENTNVDANSIEAKILESMDLLVTDSVLWLHSGEFKWDVVDKKPIYV